MHSTGPCPAAAGQLGLVRAHENESMRRLELIFRYAWTSPATAIGLVFSVLAMLAGARPRMVNGVLEVAGGHLRSLMAVLPRCAGFAAITFGHVIIGLDHSLLRCIRAHELVHVQQYERWGVLFFPLYLASSFWQLMRGRHPYLDNVFEREAYGKTSVRAEASPDVQPDASVCGGNFGHR